MSRATLAARIAYAGGDQLGRINKQKLRSLQAALLNDYNSRAIKTDKGVECHALINANLLKPDYDRKIISVEFKHGLETGDSFTILDDKTNWLVYLPILTETAYLRAEIIRARYYIDIEGEHYPVYFQGPTETDIRWLLKNQTNVNELNFSGTIYLKNTPESKAFFKRFRKFKINGETWEVQVSDHISVPGILELEIQETYENTMEELPEIKWDNARAANVSEIEGRTNVKVGEEVGYSIKPELFTSNDLDEWRIPDNPFVEIKSLHEDGRICKLIVKEDFIDHFTLKYGDYSLEVAIDIAESRIQGPTEVYPYDTVSYSLGDATGTFILQSDIAHIISVTENSCQVEIITGKSGKFILECEIDGFIESLPVTVKSL